MHPWSTVLSPHSPLSPGHLASPSPPWRLRGSPLNTRHFLLRLCPKALPQHCLQPLCSGDILHKDTHPSFSPWALAVSFPFFTSTFGRRCYPPRRFLA